MLQQMLRDSLAILRRPTLSTLQAHSRDDWRRAFLYLTIGIVIATLIQLATTVVQAPLRAQQRLEFGNRFGSGFPTIIYDVLQSPWWTLALGLFGILFAILLWIALPYGLGRAFGGTKAFGHFAYTNALFLAPIGILDALLALILSGRLGGVFLLLSLSLDAFRFYLVYLNLRAAMALSKSKAAIVVLIPVLIIVLLGCVLFVIAVFAIASRRVTP